MKGVTSFIMHLGLRFQALDLPFHSISQSDIFDPTIVIIWKKIKLNCHASWAQGSKLGLHPISIPFIYLGPKFLVP